MTTFRWNPFLPRLHFFNVAAISAGVILRAAEYLKNRSFDQDEAWRAIDVMGRSFGDILTHQFLARDLPVLPMGFALVSKALAEIFGYHEYAFRLFPLCCGILSLFVFYRLARRLLTAQGTLAALILFAFSGFLIHYSAEFNQYSLDLLVSLLLCLFWVSEPDKAQARRTVFLWMLAGFLSLLFSYPSIFILTSIAMLQIMESVLQKDWPGLKKTLLVFGFWIECFILLQGSPFQAMNRENVILVQAEKFFMPYPVWSAEAVRWLGRAFVNIFRDVLGIWPLLTIPIAAWGAAVFLRRYVRVFLFLALPLMLALGAAILHKYPFFDRFLIIFIPLFLFILVRGAADLAQRIKFGSPLIFVVLIGLIAVPQGQAVYTGLIPARAGIRVREAVRYFKKQAKPDDRIFLNRSAHFIFMFYLGKDICALGAAKVTVISDRVFLDNGAPAVDMQDVRYECGRQGFLKGMEDLEITRFGAQDAGMLFGPSGRTWFFIASTGPGIKGFVKNAIAGTSVNTITIESPEVWLSLYDKN